MQGIERETLKERLRARGICVIIPTYNNEQTVRQVVESAQEYCADVLVVNDGSTDRTAQILSEISGITLVSYEHNRGKGYALRQGFERAKALSFAYAITLDADGQHYAEDIPSFLQANIAHPGALIVGERDLNGVERSSGSSFANRFSNFWFFVQTGKRLADTQTGYRLYPIKKLRYLRVMPARYEAELALMVLASWHGVPLVSIPVDVYYPPKEERVSHFRPYKDFLRITVLNTVLCFLAVVYGLPCRLARGLVRMVRTVYSLFIFSFFSFFVVTPLAYLYLKWGKMTEAKRRSLHRMIYSIARIIVLKHGIPGGKFSCHIAKQVDFDKPSVLICNHQSHLDLICQLTLTPKVVFLTNQWVWRNPFYGYVIRHAEYQTVTEGIDALLPKLRSLVDRGYSIALYPEGTRSVDCRISRFHRGAFYIAEQLHLGITPMFLYGTGRRLPKKKYSLHRSPIYLEVDETMTQAQLQAIGSPMEQAKWMCRHYVEKYNTLCDEFEKNS